MVSLSLPHCFPAVGVPGLWMVETLDSVKTADILNRYWSLRERGDDPLRVLVQINTSNEDSESTVADTAYEIQLIWIASVFVFILNPNMQL